MTSGRGKKCAELVYSFETKYIDISTFIWPEVEKLKWPASNLAHPK